MSTNITSLPSSLLSPSAATSTTTSSSSSGTSTDNVSAEKNEFLQLLVAQLSHQDPMDPTDSSQFVSQLAQFSALEQTAQTNSEITDLTSAVTSSNRAGMAGLVGKTVTANASTFNVDATGAAPACSINLGGTASSVQVSLVDGTGKTVRTATMGATAGGNVPVVWPSGSALPAGQYTVSVKATAPDGSTVTASPEIQGVISSLGFANGSSTFTINGVTVSPSDILSIQN
jgi:flagellar basal-body rod modification protein FlgD